MKNMNLSFKPVIVLAAVAAATYAWQGGTAEARPARETTPAVITSVTEQAATAKPAAALRYLTASAGNAARYRIREQLVGLDLPNDAVGETKIVSGVIAADAKGKIIPAESKFTVDVSKLVSDKDRRDRFVAGRVLETAQYPTVTLVPTSIRGLSLPLPKSGTRTFELLGDLTVRGTTRPTVWKVTAQFQPDRMTGTAATAFTFDDFSIQQPRVPVVLSVADTIKLELDFTMVPAPAK
jgi:polyisoprenoid-binding protein YceI